MGDSIVLSIPRKGLEEIAERAEEFIEFVGVQGVQAKEQVKFPLETGQVQIFGTHFRHKELVFLLYQSTLYRMCPTAPDTMEFMKRDPTGFRRVLDYMDAQIREIKEASGEFGEKREVDTSQQTFLAAFRLSTTRWDKIPREVVGDLTCALEDALDKGNSSHFFDDVMATVPINDDSLGLYLRWGDLIELSSSSLDLGGLKLGHPIAFSSALGELQRTYSNLKEEFKAYRPKRKRVPRINSQPLNLGYR